MGISSSIMKPQELAEFRKLNTSIDNIEIPTRPENRTVTDKKGFFFFGIPILIFLPLLIYTLVKSDIRRIYYGYDSCGNLCGYNNPKVEGIACSGKDYILQRYTYRTPQGRYNKSSCLVSCPQGTEAHSLPERCEKEEEIKNPFESDLDKLRNRRDLITDDPDMFESNFMRTLKECQRYWWKFLINIVVAVGLSLIMLCLLRYTPAVLVWSILILSLVVAIGATVGLWYAHSQQKDENDKSVLLFAAIAMSIFTVGIVIILFCLFKKIKLVILLFKEATKAVFAMPLIIFIPVLTTIVQCAVLIAFAISTLWMWTARDLRKYEEDYYEYEMNGVMMFTIVFNAIMTFWAMCFIAGFQYMTIAGSVATWFFAKNKEYLGSPIMTSFSNAVKFHTGTVAFGSFILVLMAIVRALIESVFKNDRLRCVIECCCDNIEAFLKFLSKNAYIETAIHGQSFLRSGKRAAKILLSNAASVIAINSVGDFVLGMIKFLVVIIATGVAMILFKNFEHYWFPALICLIVNIIIAAIIFGIFTATIDTLFICFCEDKTINDGVSRPYFMSRGLMEFIETSKTVYGKI